MGGFSTVSRELVEKTVPFRSISWYNETVLVSLLWADGSKRPDRARKGSQKKPCRQAQLAELLHADKAAIARRTKNLEAKGLLIRRDAPSDRRSQLLYPTKKAESLRSSKAEIEAAFYEYLTNVLTAEEAAAFAAALNKLYTASKTESRAGFPHFRKAAGGEAAHEKG